MRGLRLPSGMRVELWIGAYALFAGTVIVLPTLVLVEQRLETSLVDHELDLVSREERILVRTLEDHVEATEGSVMRLGRRISSLPAEPTAADLAEFERVVTIDPDGARRSRRDRFDAESEAGIWIPRHAPVDDTLRAFYVRSKRAIEDATGLMDSSIAENAWLLLDHGGEVIFWPRAPGFVYEASPTHDYSDTDWVRLARPENDPRGEPRWTRVEFDPVPHVWMVSVVAPFTRGGAFAGTVGHDIPLGRIVDPSAGAPERSGTTCMVIDAEGRLLASSHHAREIREGRGRFSVRNLRDRRLRDAVERLSRATRGGTEVRRVSTDSHIVLGTRIAATDWTVISAIPRESIAARISAPIRTMRNATLAALALFVAATVFTIEQDRRRRQEALRHLHESEEKLARAQKLEALGRFAGGIAHDFNNVLSVISGFAEVAQRRAKTDAQLRDHLDQILRACQRASELTKQLLAFAKNQPVRAQVVDLNELLRSTHKLLRRVMGEDVELVTLPSSESASVVGDPGQIEQVLTNLAINARDAMPDGGKFTISVTVTATNVVVSVSDTGTGMSPEVLQQATEPFFTTKGAGRGTGLGLATCQTILEQMGGELGIESTLGQGTTFHLRFPKSDVVAISSASVETPAFVRAHGELVLLVEDDFHVRRVVGQLLEGHGFTVALAENGAEGLAVVRARHREIACIVTDVVMPILGGGRFLTILKREHPELPIVVTSGYVDDPSIRDDLRELDVAFLPKPFTAVQLTAAVVDAIERDRGARTNAS